jgi:hypothetical protein
VLPPLPGIGCFARATSEGPAVAASFGDPANDGDAVADLATSRDSLATNGFDLINGAAGRAFDDVAAGPEGSGVS